MNTSYSEPNYTTITGPCNKIGKSIRRITEDSTKIQANPGMNAHGSVKLMPLDTSGNAELQDDEWDESKVHEFYKRPMPKWFSDEAFTLDSKKYYVVPESKLHDNDLLQLLMECLDAYLPLEVKNVVVETFEDEPRDKLMANNAIFYLSYKCCADACSTPLAGDHLSIGFDLDYNYDPPTLVRSTWGKNYDIGLYGRIGLQCRNLHKGTNLKFKRLEKHSIKLTGYVNFYITLEATDPATGSLCSFQTLFIDFGSCLSLGARITWVTFASRIKQIPNEPVDDEWEEEDTPGINEFYKGPLPKWFSDEALERDTKKYYVVPESGCITMTGFNFSWKSPSSPKQNVHCLDAYLPLELKNVVVETFEDYTTEPSEKLKADNAIFYISYKCCSDPFLRLGGPHFLTGDHRAIVRKIMDGKPGHMRLEVALTREQENK
ncbi:unnamed protein product [Brassica rapa subsp. trilocularis]